MQDRAVHYDRPGTDLDPTRCGMQVRTLIQVYAVTQPDVIGKPDADIALDCSRAIHMQNEAVQNTSDGDPNHGWNPAKKNQEKLLVKISKNGRGLTIKV